MQNGHWMVMMGEAKSAYEPEQQAGDFGDRARASGHQADTANDAENDATHLAMAIISTAIPCAA